jgi:hypothetical protein
VAMVHTKFHMDQIKIKHDISRRLTVDHATGGNHNARRAVHNSGKVWAGVGF